MFTDPSALQALSTRILGVKHMMCTAPPTDWSEVYCTHAAQGIAVPAEHEEVLPAELREAWFTVLKAAHRGKPRPGPYYVRRGCCTCAQLQVRTERGAPPHCNVQQCSAPARPIDLQVLRSRYNQWLLHGMPAVEAYSERAAANVAANAFLQARADAASALHVLRKPEASGSKVCASLALTCVR